VPPENITFIISIIFPRRYTIEDPLPQLPESEATPVQRDSTEFSSFTDAEFTSQFTHLVGRTSLLPWTELNAIVLRGNETGEINDDER